MIIYWGSIFVVFFVAGLLVPLFLLWSPIGAFISIRQARKRGLNAWHYGTIGFLYSVLFLLPWVYLTIRMSQRSIPRRSIVVGYMTIYFFWATLFVATSDFLGGALTLAFAALAILSAGYLLVRLHELSQPRALYNQPQGPPAEYTHRIKDLVYIAPFIFVGIQTVLWLVVQRFGDSP